MTALLDLDADFVPLIAIVGKGPITASLAEALQEASIEEEATHAGSARGTTNDEAPRQFRYKMHPEPNGFGERRQMHDLDEYETLEADGILPAHWYRKHSSEIPCAAILCVPADAPLDNDAAWEQISVSAGESLRWLRNELETRACGVLSVVVVSGRPTTRDEDDPLMRDRVAARYEQVVQGMGGRSHECTLLYELDARAGRAATRVLRRVHREAAVAVEDSLDRRAARARSVRLRLQRGPSRGSAGRAGLLARACLKAAHWAELRGREADVDRWLVEALGALSTVGKSGSDSGPGVEEAREVASWTALRLARSRLRKRRDVRGAVMVMQRLLGLFGELRGDLDRELESLVHDWAARTLALFGLLLLKHPPVRIGPASHPSLCPDSYFHAAALHALRGSEPRLKWPPAKKPTSSDIYPARYLGAPLASPEETSAALGGPPPAVWLLDQAQRVARWDAGLDRPTETPSRARLVRDLLRVEADSSRPWSETLSRVAPLAARALAEGHPRVARRCLACVARDLDDPASGSERDRSLLRALLLSLAARSHTEPSTAAPWKSPIPGDASPGWVAGPKGLALGGAQLLQDEQIRDILAKLPADKGLVPDSVQWNSGFEVVKDGDGGDFLAGEHGGVLAEKASGPLAKSVLVGGDGGVLAEKASGSHAPSPKTTSPPSPQTTTLRTMTNRPRVRIGFDRDRVHPGDEVQVTVAVDRESVTSVRVRTTVGTVVAEGPFEKVDRGSSEWWVCRVSWRCGDEVLGAGDGEFEGFVQPLPLPRRVAVGALVAANGGRADDAVASGEKVVSWTGDDVDVTAPWLHEVGEDEVAVLATEGRNVGIATVRGTGRSGAKAGRGGTRGVWAGAPAALQYRAPAWAEPLSSNARKLLRDSIAPSSSPSSIDLSEDSIRPEDEAARAVLDDALTLPWAPMGAVPAMAVAALVETAEGQRRAEVVVAVGAASRAAALATRQANGGFPTLAGPLRSWPALLAADRARVRTAGIATVRENEDLAAAAARKARRKAGLPEEPEQEVKPTTVLELHAHRVPKDDLIFTASSPKRPNFPAPDTSALAKFTAPFGLPRLLICPRTSPLQVRIMAPHSPFPDGARCPLLVTVCNASDRPTSSSAALVLGAAARVESRPLGIAPGRDTRAASAKALHLALDPAGANPDGLADLSAAPTESPPARLRVFLPSSAEVFDLASKDSAKIALESNTTPKDFSPLPEPGPNYVPAVQIPPLQPWDSFAVWIIVETPPALGYATQPSVVVSARTLLTDERHRLETSDCVTAPVVPAFSAEYLLRPLSGRRPLLLRPWPGAAIPPPPPPAALGPTLPNLPSTLIVSISSTLPLQVCDHRFDGADPDLHLDPVTADSDKATPRVESAPASCTLAATVRPCPHLDLLEGGTGQSDPMVLLRSGSLQVSYNLKTRAGPALEGQSALSLPDICIANPPVQARLEWPMDAATDSVTKGTLVVASQLPNAASAILQLSNQSTAEPVLRPLGKTVQSITLLPSQSATFEIPLLACGKGIARRPALQIIALADDGSQHTVLDTIQDAQTTKIL